MATSGQLGWDGFTDEDLQKIRQQNQIEDLAMEDSILQESRPIAVGLVSQKMSRTKRKAAFHSSPRRAVVNGSGEVMLKPNNVLQSTETVVTFGMDDRKEVLIQQNASAASLPTSNIINSEIKDEGPLLADVPKSGDVDEVNTHKSKDIETTSSSHHLREINCVVEACDSSERNNNDNDLSNRKLSLRELQMRQKLLEEQNNMKRAALAKTIDERKKKTQAEAAKLCSVQMELQKLDSLVSNDVSILRNQIEIASMEFNDAQKRYDKAEKEFVEAKSELFSKMERKERLIEHLCTIIEENELRKANKLAQLMKELDLETFAANCPQ